MKLRREETSLDRRVRSAAWPILGSQAVLVVGMLLRDLSSGVLSDRLE